MTWRPSWDTCLTDCSLISHSQQFKYGQSFVGKYLKSLFGTTAEDQHVESRLTGERERLGDYTERGCKRSETAEQHLCGQTEPVTASQSGRTKFTFLCTEDTKNVKVTLNWIYLFKNAAELWYGGATHTVALYDNITQFSISQVLVST